MSFSHGLNTDLIEAEGDGNCAYNAFALALCEGEVLNQLEAECKRERKDPNIVYAEFIKRIFNANGFKSVQPKDRTWPFLKNWLQENRERNPVILQKVLAPILREFSIDLIKAETNSLRSAKAHKEESFAHFIEEFNYLVEEELQIPHLGTKGDIFDRHRFIKERYKLEVSTVWDNFKQKLEDKGWLQEYETYKIAKNEEQFKKYRDLYEETLEESKTALKKWWLEDNAYDKFLDAMKVPSTYAGDLELNILSEYFKVNCKVILRGGYKIDGFGYGEIPAKIDFEYDLDSNEAWDVSTESYKVYLIKRGIIRQQQTAGFFPLVELDRDSVSRRLSEIPDYKKVCYLISSTERNNILDTSQLSPLCISELQDRGVIKKDSSANKYYLIIDSEVALQYLDGIPTKEAFLKAWDIYHCVPPTLTLQNLNANHWDAYKYIKPKKIAEVKTIPIISTTTVTGTPVVSIPSSIESSFSSTKINDDSEKISPSPLPTDPINASTSFQKELFCNQLSKKVMFEDPKEEEKSTLFYKHLLARGIIQIKPTDSKTGPSVYELAALDREEVLKRLKPIPDEKEAYFKMYDLATEFTDPVVPIMNIKDERIEIADLSLECKNQLIARGIIRFDSNFYYMNVDLLEAGQRMRGIETDSLEVFLDEWEKQSKSSVKLKLQLSESDHWEVYDDHVVSSSAALPLSHPVSSMITSPNVSKEKKVSLDEKDKKTLGLSGSVNSSSSIPTPNIPSSASTPRPSTPPPFSPGSPAASTPSPSTPPFSPSSPAASTPSPSTPPSSPSSSAASTPSPSTPPSSPSSSAASTPSPSTPPSSPSFPAASMPSPSTPSSSPSSPASTTPIPSTPPSTSSTPASVSRPSTPSSSPSAPDLVIRSRATPPPENSVYTEAETALKTVAEKWVSNLIDNANTILVKHIKEWSDKKDSALDTKSITEKLHTAMTKTPSKLNISSSDIKRVIKDEKDEKIIDSSLGSASGECNKDYLQPGKIAECEIIANNKAKGGKFKEKFVGGLLQVIPDFKSMPEAKENLFDDGTHFVPSLAIFQFIDAMFKPFLNNPTFANQPLLIRGHENVNYIRAVMQFCAANGLKVNYEMSREKSDILANYIPTPTELKVVKEQIEKGNLTPIQLKKDSTLLTAELKGLNNVKTKLDRLPDTPKKETLLKAFNDVKEIIGETREGKVTGDTVRKFEEIVSDNARRRP